MPQINLDYLRQTVFCSKSLSIGTVVVLPATETGVFEFGIHKDSKLINSVQVKVREEKLDIKNPPPNIDAKQITAVIDTSIYDNPNVKPGFVPKKSFEIYTNGYIVLQCTSAPVQSNGVPRGYNITSRKLANPTSKPIGVDVLPKGSLFAMTLFRPGEYMLTDKVSGKTGTIVVEKVEKGTKYVFPKEPLNININSGSFSESKIVITPGKGLVFKVEEGTADIEIELTKPFDPPKPAPPSRS